MVLEKKMQVKARALDMSGMSEGKRVALEMAEAARESAWEKPSFAARLFMGNFRYDFLNPFPKPGDEQKEKGQGFLEKLSLVLKEHIDPDEIDRTGIIPDIVFEKLTEIGALGIKISPEYGGLGLSQLNYVKSAVLMGSYCSNTAAFLSVHQSVGVPQPLILFGNDEQKKKYLPQICKGAISAFALTEKEVGSDPAKIRTTATPTTDGKHFLINGEKLWCTNGTRASLLVVAAKIVSDKKTADNEKKQLTCFIVETNMPGVSVIQECDFMGLKAIANGVLRFENVRVPVENIIGGAGRGLKVALQTLNTGRLTIAGMSVGLAKRCLKITRNWANKREQWGAPIGKHAAIADKIARMGANVFAMEALLYLTSTLVDENKLDLRLLSAMTKLYCTEKTWDIINDCMQVRGGRGYETAQSLKTRGEAPYPVERFLRDQRISTIFEGSSEIMRLMISREALDRHLRIAGEAIHKTAPFRRRFKAGVKAAAYYIPWYLGKMLPAMGGFGKSPRPLRKHLHYIRGTSKKLARKIFHAMLLKGRKLEAEQVLLGRLVDIGTQLTVMASICAYAEHLLRKETASRENVLSLADLYCKQACLKIDALFKSHGNNQDSLNYKRAQEFLAGKYTWLEEDIFNEEME